MLDHGFKSKMSIIFSYNVSFSCKRLDQQEVQKAIQNSRANLRQEALTPGTRVMLKRDGILSKLEARFSGPFPHGYPKKTSISWK